MADVILIILAIGLGMGMLLAERLGAALARRLGRERSADAPVGGRMGHVLTTTFSLLALLIGFSFSIVVDRYDTRRADAVAEANAIGTAHLRAGLIAEAGGSLQEILGDYARLRARYAEATGAARRSIEADSAELRGVIAGAAGGIGPVATTPLGTSVVESVNEVLDAGTQREANMRAKLPLPVFAVLVGLSLAGAGLTGFAYPGDGAIRRSSSTLLFVLLTATIALIVHLDRPDGTIDRVSMKEMLDTLGDPASADDAQNERIGR